MAIPVKATFNAGDTNGLAEFTAGDTLVMEGNGGGSVTLNIDASLATDETFDLSTMGIVGGSGTNGTYTKFPDGTLICVNMITLTDVAFTAHGNSYISAQQGVNFEEVDFVGGGVVVGSAGMYWDVRASEVADGARACTFRLGANSDTTEASIIVRFTATGRWK